MMFTDSDVRRFLAKVDRDGPVPNHRPELGSCWIWTASIRLPGGYGQFRLNGTTVGAHRVAHLMAHGSIPFGLNVLHACDNRACVRPEHLFVGTDQDNTDDMMRKGRHVRANLGRVWPVRYEDRPRGEGVGNHVLIEAEVEEMRRLWATGEWTGPALAERFAVTQNTALRAVTGETWAHLALLAQPTPEQMEGLRIGSLPRGAAHPNAKMTDELVAWARERHAAGETFRAIAKAVGVSETTISRAIKRQGWRHCA